MDNTAKYNAKLKLIEDSIALKNTSRIPNCTRVNAWPLYEYGMTRAESMRDYDRLNELFARFHREFDPDLASLCGTSYPSRVLELFDIQNVRWPGDPKGLDENQGFQYIEYPTLMEDEYDMCLDNPIQFAVEKWLPRVNNVFKPLCDIDYTFMVTGLFNQITAFTSQPMLEMYEKFKKAAAELERYRKAMDEGARMIRELGYPDLAGGPGQTAFDMVGDTLRGTFGLMPDLIEQPEKVKRMCDVFVHKEIEDSLNNFKNTGVRYQWVMLHKGSEEFISLDMFEEFYWPYLRQWILAMIENGCTPVVFAEGAYNSRLPYLADVPKGKVLYLFEDVDWKLVRRHLGGVAGVMGGMSFYDVVGGTRESIFEKVKQVMDIMGPEPGYLFSTSCGIDECPRANLEALFEAVELYGKRQ